MSIYLFLAGTPHVNSNSDQEILETLEEIAAAAPPVNSDVALSPKCRPPIP